MGDPYHRRSPTRQRAYQTIRKARGVEHVGLPAYARQEVREEQVKERRGNPLGKGKDAANATRSRRGLKYPDYWANSPVGRRVFLLGHVITETITAKEFAEIKKVLAEQKDAKNDIKRLIDGLKEWLDNEDYHSTE